MTFESIINVPAHCPECNAVVGPKDENCPNCGHTLKLSSLEQEALKYKKSIGYGQRERSNLAMIIFVLVTFFLLLATLGLYDEYSIEQSETSKEEAFTVFLFFGSVFVTFLGLSILCYFKPMAASIIGMIAFSIILGFCIIGFVFNDEAYTDEDIRDLTITLAIFLLIPVLLLIAIYKLKRKRRITSL